jgi:hypothetical protein
MMDKLKIGLVSAGAFAPLAVFGQTSFNNIDNAFATVLRILNQYVIPLIIGIAVIYFLVGVLSYIRKSGDEGARAEARQMMLWGIIGIFVMTAVWGLVNVLGDTLNLKNQVPNLPDVPRTNPDDDIRR